VRRTGAQRRREKQRDDAIEARIEADRQTVIAKEAAETAREAEKRVKEALKFSSNTLLGIDSLPGITSMMPDIGDFELNTPKGADRASLYAIMSLAVGRLTAEEQQVSDGALLDFLTGLELIRDRDSQRARPYIIKAADAHPEIRLFGFVASLVTANLRDYDESIRRARMLVERFPEDAELIFHLADLLDALRWTETQLAGTLIPEIRQLCRRAIQLSPKYVSPRLLLMKLAEDGSAEELKATEAELRGLLEFSPDQDIRKALVSNLRVQQRFEDAFNENQPLISVASPSPNDLLVNAKLLRSIGRPKEAILAFSQFEALRLALPEGSPFRDNVSHLNDWGVALTELHQFKEALEILQRIRTEYEGNPVYESNVAMAFLGDEKYDRAVAIWKDIASAADADKRVSENVYLIQGLICAGKSDEAMDVVMNAKYEAPDRPQQFDYLFVGLSQLAAITSGAEPILAKEWNAMQTRPESANKKWDYFYLRRFSETLTGDSAIAFAKQLTAIQLNVPERTIE
jgi:tetratricopeptide (TPR) repeat protein